MSLLLETNRRLQEQHDSVLSIRAMLILFTVIVVPGLIGTCI